MQIHDVYYEPFVLNGGFYRLIFIFKVYEVDRMEHLESYEYILVLPLCEILASDVVLLAVATEEPVL